MTPLTHSDGKPLALATADKMLQVANLMLASVATTEEAKELISMAETARVYARQSKLGTEAINHATVIKLRAERKLADIVDEGQERGEIARADNGGANVGVRCADTAPTPLPELGIDRQRLAEARILRDHYTDAELDQLKNTANEQDEILSRQRLIQDARAKNEQNAEVQRARVAVVFPVYEALENLATVGMPASEWAKQVPFFSKHRVTEHIAAATAWLNELREVWHEPSN